MPAVIRLTLTDFRSYAAAEVRVGAHAIVVTGDNGQGKTNLLDAVSLLSPGRGLRGVALSDAARSDGPGGWTVAADVVAAGGSVAIGTGTTAAAPDRRVVRINGAPAPVAQLGEWLSVLWLTPAMDRLFTDTASARRRFLDRLVLALDPRHGGHLTRYEAAMRQRNRLLASDAPDAGWLTALEQSMGEHAGPITGARLETAIALSKMIWALPAGPFPRARLAVSNILESSALPRRLAASRAVHAAAGRTLVGPHTEDLIVTYAEKDAPAARGSTGEQKALLLGLILAHADLVAERTGQPPIVLLDEVAAHLDPRRRAALFDRLHGRGQVWLTGTEASLFAGLDAQRLHIEHGIVA
jgi:DNA replication and repair protein RecF